MCPQYTVYGIVCHISHMCACNRYCNHVITEENQQCAAKLANAHIIDDLPSLSLQE